MSNTKIAAQLWTIREDIKTPEAFAASMKRLAEIGYRAVQPNWKIPFETPEELKAVLDENGIVCCATHYPADAYTTDLDAVIALHKVMNCSYPGVGGAPREARAGGAATSAWAKQMHEVCAKLKANGMRFAYHNHAWEFARVEGRTMMDVLLEEAPEDFTFELDLYWVQAGGANPVSWIKKCKGRCPVLHFKDMGIEEGKTADVPVGEGNLEWPAILEAAAESGAEWYVVEEDHPLNGDGFACLETSLKNLNALGVT
jgi:sugar phosphate isomerase/epimerase